MARYSKWSHGHQLVALSLDYTSGSFGRAGPQDMLLSLGLLALDEYFDPLQEYTLKADDDSPERVRKVAPFYVEVTPYKEGGQSKPPQNRHTTTQFEAIEMLENWVSSLNLRSGRRLIMVGYNLPMMRMLLIDFLGYEIYQSIFWDEFSISLDTLATCWLERSEKRKEPLMMRLDRGLAGVATHLGCNSYKRNDLLLQCVAIGEVARKFLGMPRF